MRLLVDTSVWIDLFADRSTLQTTVGRRLIEQGEQMLVGDLILTEVLQGTRDKRDFDSKLTLLRSFEALTITDHRTAIAAARNYQELRARGVTVRKTIDTLIATRCIVDGLPLLYSDRDFDPFVTHLGLRSALDDTGAA